MTLFRFVLRRLSQGLITIVGVVTITFLVSHIIPADPAALMAGERATPQEIAQIRHDYGFDQPLPEQLAGYFRHLLQGDLGRSAYTSRDISQDLAARLPATLELTLVALLLSIAIGIPLGVLSAVRRNSPLDHARSGCLPCRVYAHRQLLAGHPAATALRDAAGLAPARRPDPVARHPMTITGLYLLDSLVTGNAAGVCRRRTSYCTADDNPRISSDGHGRALHPAPALLEVLGRPGMSTISARWGCRPD